MVIQPFEFQTNRRLVFGPGKLNILPYLVKNFNDDILVITGVRTFSANPNIQHVIDMVKLSGKKVFLEKIHGEPSPGQVDTIVAAYVNKDIGLIVAIGGGSAVDTGKAVSAMLPAGESVVNYLEGIGTKKHDGQKIPFIAIPTTAGTGSEATKNAVLSEIAEDGYKCSLRHDNFIPDIALIDPLLTINCTQEVTAAGGLDAFTQLLESYVSPKASPITDALAFSGMKMIKNAMITAYSTGNDEMARTAMAYGAYISGITLSNAGLGLVHGFASSIGGILHIPHGVICGTLLGACTEETIKALFANGQSEYLDKYAGTGFLLNGYETTVKNENQRLEGCELLIKTIGLWIRKMNIPLLGQYGLQERHIDLVVNGTDNKSNPVILSKEIIKKILLKRI